MRVLLLILSLLLAGCASPGQYNFHPAYETTLGPETARGAIIYSHGWPGYNTGEPGYKAPLPALMTAFRQDGWDVYRLDRISEDKDDAAGKLVTLTNDLQQRGYQRIVLAGQSAGAFISLIAASHTDVDAVIALAPAYYGSNEGNNSNFIFSGTMIVSSVRDIRHGIIVTAFFSNDYYDPADRSAEVERVLNEHNIVHLVIDHPPVLPAISPTRARRLPPAMESVC
jgi:pimeloyl-ACP methyl ester carboxylesterase